MRRAGLVIAAALLACGIGFFAVYSLQTSKPPAQWMGQRLGLGGEALAEFTAAHNRYFSFCADMCRRIDTAEGKLVAAVRSHREMTADVAAALEEADALRTECRKAMLEHFYEVAELLNESQQAEYLELVLPLIVDPGNMRQAHHRE
jgi:hypothetical protein